MDVNSKQDLGSLTIDDLLALREQVQEILRKRLKAKQAELDRQLHRALSSLPRGLDDVGLRTHMLSRWGEDPWTCSMAV